MNLRKFFSLALIFYHPLFSIGCYFAVVGQLIKPPAVWGQTKKDCSITSTALIPHIGTNLIPLTDMGQGKTYHGDPGGLYGNATNEPPPAHLQQAQSAAAKVKPRQANGNEDSVSGKIGLVSIGMSNTTQEFQAFMTLVNAAGSGKSSRVVLIDGAYPAMTAGGWVHRRESTFDPWANLSTQVSNAGLTKSQVQVVWMKLTNADPDQPGREDHPVFAQDLQDDLGIIVKRVKTEYPNVQLIFFSSRTYAGYSLTNLSPEPSAYETAFAKRWLIDDQIAGGGRTGVTYQNAPVMIWGPYLWANGIIPRADGFTWVCDDVRTDGVHPSDAGRLKVAHQLLNFFNSSAFSKSWFTGSAGTAPSVSPSASAPTFAKGDVNHDGSVNYLDMRVILNNFSSLASSVPNYFDPVGDTKINTVDFGYWRADTEV